MTTSKIHNWYVLSSWRKHSNSMCKSINIRILAMLHCKWYCKIPGRRTLLGGGAVVAIQYAWARTNISYTIFHHDECKCIIQCVCNAAQAPRKPSTSLGEMVNYYLKMEPHLFKEAVNTQFERIKEEREEAAAAAKERQKNAPPASSDKSEMVLHRCPLFFKTTCCYAPLSAMTSRLSWIT